MILEKKVFAGFTILWDLHFTGKKVTSIALGHIWKKNQEQKGFFSPLLSPLHPKKLSKQQTFRLFSKSMRYIVGSWVDGLPKKTQTKNFSKWIRNFYSVTFRLKKNLVRSFWNYFLTVQNNFIDFLDSWCSEWSKIRNWKINKNILHF